MEKKVIRKWFWVWDFEKEERWLNEMAESGWALEQVGFCKYTFVPSEPGEYIIRLEMHDSDEQYMSFMNEIGAEFVGSIVRWLYFRRPSSEGPFDLFSDVDSRIEHLNGISRFIFAMGILNLGIGVMNSVNGSSLGWINLLVATLLMYGLGRIHGKREALERERELHE